MNRIDSDLRALADETARQLPRLDDTARALARGRQGGSMRIVKKLAIAVVLVGAVLICPIPYSRVVGYDLAVRAAGGRATTVHLATRDAARAERRAEALRQRGAAVTVAARTEHVWGTVYGMAASTLFSIDVAVENKTDEQIEEEIRSQLAQAGWSADQVQVQSGSDGREVTVDATDGARRIMMVRKGGDEGRVQIEEPALDTARDPGMTDAQLRDKILQQLRARGLDGDVTVDGDKIGIQATKTK